MGMSRRTQEISNAELARSVIEAAAREAVQGVPSTVLKRLGINEGSLVDGLMKLEAGHELATRLVPFLVQKLDALKKTERKQFALASLSSNIFTSPPGVFSKAFRETLSQYFSSLNKPFRRFSRGEQLLFLLGTHAPADKAIELLSSKDPALVYAATWRAFEGVFKDPAVFIRLQREYKDKFPGLLDYWIYEEALYISLSVLSRLPWDAVVPEPDPRLVFTRAQDDLQALLFAALENTAETALPFPTKESVVFGARQVGFWWGLFMVQKYSPEAAETFFRAVVARVNNLNGDKRREFIRRYEGVEMLAPVLLALGVTA